MQKTLRAVIKAIFEQGGLDAVLRKLPNDIFAGKIRALVGAYGFSYSFLRFYGSERCVIAAYYGAAVLAGQADGETVDFCAAAGFREVFMSEAVYLSAFGGISSERANIMEYKGAGATLPEEVRTDPEYGEVFEILREGFPLKFDEWYTDTCHLVRHGISSLYTLSGVSALQCAFAEGGTALISLICTKKSAREQGFGLSLVKAVSGGLALNNRVFLVCRDETADFYKKAGYIKTGCCRTI